MAQSLVNVFTVVLDPLEKAGVIRRAPNPSDRRSSIVHVSPKFLRTAQAAYSEMDRATDMLPAASVEHFFDSIDQV